LQKKKDSALTIDVDEENGALNAAPGKARLKKSLNCSIAFGEPRTQSDAHEIFP
jgi:hypothetical protein